MMTRTFFLSLLLAGSARADLPRSWELYTSTPRLFQASRDSVAATGKGSGALQGASEASTSQYALLAQKISALDYRGMRVRLSAKVQAVSVGGRAGLWIRADSADGEPLVFDNMEDRPIKGDKDWSLISIEVDIPQQAREIHFGLLLCGSGRARIDDLALTVLGEARPVAKTVSRIRSLPRAPVNGDFER